MVELIPTIIKKNKSIIDYFDVLYQFFYLTMYCYLDLESGGNLGIISFISFFAGTSFYLKNLFFIKYLFFIFLSFSYVVDMYSYYRPKNNLKNIFLIIKFFLKFLMFYEFYYLRIVEEGNLILLFSPLKEKIVKGNLYYVDNYVLNKYGYVSKTGSFYLFSPFISQGTEIVIWVFKDTYLILSLGNLKENSSLYFISKNYSLLGRYKKIFQLQNSNFILRKLFCIKVIISPIVVFIVSGIETLKKLN